MFTQLKNLHLVFWWQAGPWHPQWWQWLEEHGMCFVCWLPGMLVSSCDPLNSFFAFFTLLTALGGWSYGPPLPLYGQELEGGRRVCGVYLFPGSFRCFCLRTNLCLHWSSPILSGGLILTPILSKLDSEKHSLLQSLFPGGGNSCAALPYLCKNSLYYLSLESPLEHAQCDSDWYLGGI
jgi:hypothetical protein